MAKKKKDQSAQGTKASGFVTAEENKPPRECWNCIHYNLDVMACYNEDVMNDPEKKPIANDDGSIPAGYFDCSNYFRSRGSDESMRPDPDEDRHATLKELIQIRRGRS